MLNWKRSVIFMVFILTLPATAISCTGWRGHHRTGGHMMKGGGHMMGMGEGHMMCDGMEQGMLPEIKELPMPNTEGAKLVKHYCTQCHNMPSPALHDKSEWKSVFSRMLQRMDMMGGRWMRVAAPSKKERTVILKYLQDNSMQVFDEELFKDRKETISKAFKKTCTQCHNLPSPKQHTAKEWSSVVSRMSKHIENAKLSKISESDKKEILIFLTSNAKTK